MGYWDPPDMDDVQDCAYDCEAIWGTYECRCDYCSYCGYWGSANHDCRITGRNLIEQHRLELEGEAEYQRQLDMAEDYESSMPEMTGDEHLYTGVASDMAYDSARERRAFLGYWN